MPRAAARATRRTGCGDGSPRHTAGPFPIFPLFLCIVMAAGSCCARRRQAGLIPGDLLDGDVVEGRVMEGEIARAGREADQGIQGYRVQLFASTVREEAEGVADVVRGLFTEKVYIDFSEPYYKIRVGNYATLEAAEAMRRRVAEIGYEDAWVIETTIEAE
jgi:hypothetical protein